MYRSAFPTLPGIFTHSRCHWVRCCQARDFLQITTTNTLNPIPTTDDLCQLFPWRAPALQQLSFFPTAKNSSLAPPIPMVFTAHAQFFLPHNQHAMASRLLSLARGGVRSGRLLALRNYTNGENAIPLTFSSPNSVSGAQLCWCAINRMSPTRRSTTT